jgi:hypothetical protein
LKSGDLPEVAARFLRINFQKALWLLKNKLGYAFSNSKQKLYKQISLIHFRAQDNYIATTYPGKITLIECGTFKVEYREGWKNLAEGGFETHSIPGTDHKNIVKEPNLKLFAEKLNFVLEKTHLEMGSNGQTKELAHMKKAKENAKDIVA